MSSSDWKSKEKKKIKEDFQEDFGFVSSFLFFMGTRLFLHHTFK